MLLRNNCLNVIIPTPLDLTTSSLLSYTSVPPNLPRLFKNGFVRVIDSKTWPLWWKTSYITPLYKSSSINDISNYRPISVLPKTSLNFSYVYPNISPVIKRQQFGCTERRDTVTQRISYLDKIYSSFDAKTPCLSVQV